LLSDSAAPLRATARRMGQYEVSAAISDELDYLRPPEGTGRLLAELTVATEETTPLCSGREAEFIDYDEAPSPEQARNMCAGCPLLDPCRRYGEAARPFGVWGGNVYDG